MTSCYTYPDEKIFNFKWIIHKYSSCQLSNGESLCSSLFSFNYLPDLKLSGYLMFYPYGYRKEVQHYLSVGIKLNPISTNPDGKWKLNTKLLLLYKKESRESTFDMNDTKNLINIEFIKREDLKAKETSSLADDTLTILCEIKYSDWKLNQISMNLTYERSETKLNNDLANLFENGKNWDVTLVVDVHELHAHKCILASRSDVFAAMFEHEMEESKSNRVIITDCDHEVLKEMLRYIYTGKAPNLNKMAAELLAVCDKYGLENLKYMCEDELGNHLTIDTVAETLILADLYRAKELKEHTIHFMNTHAKAVTKTEGWKKLANNHFNLIVEVYLKLVE